MREERLREFRRHATGRQVVDAPALVVQALRMWDAEVFRRTASRQSPALDVVLPALTRTADYGLLWTVIGANLWRSKRRQARRAARRGLTSLAVTSLLANQIGKRAIPRARPPLDRVPLRRLAARVPASSSFPSGHAASAAAFASAAGLADPVLGLPLTALAAAVAYSRVYTGVHYPSDVLAGAALGVAVAATGVRVAPVRTRNPVRVLEPWPAPQPPRPRGEGVVAVINPTAGGGRGARLLESVGRELPLARIVSLSPGGDLVKVLRDAATQAEVLAIGGGDGSVSAAARVAAEAGLPLLVLPGGTLNHFAADLRLTSPETAFAALREGSAIRVDLGTVTGVDADSGEQLAHTFVNTSSLGSYLIFVTVRERWESRLGKPLAAMVAIWSVLRSERPLRAVINGRELLLGMIFIGNSRYQPHGIAPSWRPRLDDGMLDVGVPLPGNYGAMHTRQRSRHSGGLRWPSPVTARTAVVMIGALLGIIYAGILGGCLLVARRRAGVVRVVAAAAAVLWGRGWLLAAQLARPG